MRPERPAVCLSPPSIIRGDSLRGPYALFCYAFATVRASLAQAGDLIAHLQQLRPSWRVNFKVDRPRLPSAPTYVLPYAPTYAPSYAPSYAPTYPYATAYPYCPPGFLHPPLTPQYPLYSAATVAVSSEKIAGEKPCKIMVRELWMGGIPEGVERSRLLSVMSEYGIVEEIEMFPRFAFVKFKQATEATNAF